MERGNETLRGTEDCDLSPLMAEFCRTFSAERRGLRGAAPGHSPNASAHRGLDWADEAREREGHRSGTLLRLENTKFGGPGDWRASGSVAAIGGRRKGSYRLLQ